MLAIAARPSFRLWRLAPSTAAPMRTPRSSISTGHLTPAFLQSVRLGPVFSQRRLGHSPVHPQLVPIYVLSCIERFDADLLAFREHASGDLMRERDHKLRIWGTGLSRATLPTDSWCRGHKRWCRHSGGWTSVGDRRCADGCSRGPAGAVPV